ncbi:MAG: hypothetical protein ACR2NL_03750 [Acidimicrobiia bacterium]
MGQTVVIDDRFQGPPTSGNGGYVCGVLAEGVRGTATVTLRMPPPLGVGMTLSGDGSTSQLRHGDALIGEAHVDTLDLAIPQIPTVEVAEEASKGYRGFKDHIFPKCFVCGPDRPVGDGLRLFPGPVSQAELVATPWQPDSSLASADGSISRRYVWGALDCPSFFALRDVRLALLGRLTAQIDRSPMAEESLVVFAWPTGSDGRKHYSSTAIATESGEVMARASAVWIEISDLPG